MPDVSNEQLSQELRQEWGITIPDILSEETILDSLELRVMALIQQGPDAFFQMMYRLDISERLLRTVMHDIDAGKKIARLIYDRQLQKMRSRQFYKNKREANDEDIIW